MFRLVKYLKPFIVFILIAVVFLFIQAMSDLALPEYMSNIVNYGIQQGGITNAVPEAIRQSQMDKITVFMSAEDKNEVMRYYTLFDSASPQFTQYLKEYPQLEKEPVYILGKFSKEETAGINVIMSRAFLAVAAIKQMLQEPAKVAAAASQMGFDLSMISSGVTSDQVVQMIAKLPEEKISRIREIMNRQFDILGERMITQSAVVSVKEEYLALGMNTGRIQSSYIWRTGLFMLLLTLLSAASTVVIGYFAARVAAGLSKNLRKKVFERVESFSNTEFDRFSTASLITRSTNDVTQIQMLVIIIIRMVFYAPILGIGGIIQALRKSTSMSWIIALAVIVVISLVIVVFSITMPKFRAMQNLIDRLNLVMREGLSGMMVIRAFNTQKFEENRFEKANKDLTSTSLFINRVMVTMFPVMMLLMNGLSLLVIWIGAHRIAVSHIQVGDMMAFLQYAMLIVMSFLMLSIVFIMIPRASVSAGRVADVLETKSVINDPANPEQFDNSANGVVQFRNVSFRYPAAEEDVLHNISFTAKPGEVTAIIGPTGSGKSTLSSLLLRFYDVSIGQILIDGIDIRDVTQQDLRNRIGYVPQKSVLFSGTVESNLKYGDENAGYNQLKAAAEVAQAMDFINEKAEGFNAEISQGGKNVSGGQNQRLSIARALVKNPDILILDDCFSALDFKTDKALRSALKGYSSKSTIIIIAQRVGTVMGARQIIVLDEGKISGMGTHQELMESCNAYREIAFSQLSREELK